ncbi:MAG: hypothetical protein EZS28_022047 [Streblomastix strix]|uniref:Uncharacterized protein n=1 Tax=Streblomastix strix TaxID=222440 RepID=A0A5J4VIG4_9EUKA|nr:MAG: hypothetical protein EZS28_022047 [Streblomastix strix]
MSRIEAENFLKIKTNKLHNRGYLISTNGIEDIFANSVIENEGGTIVSNQGGKVESQSQIINKALISQVHTEIEKRVDSKNYNRKVTFNICAEPALIGTSSSSHAITNGGAIVHEPTELKVVAPLVYNIGSFLVNGTGTMDIIADNFSSTGQRIISTIRSTTEQIHDDIAQSRYLLSGIMGEDVNMLIKEKDIETEGKLKLTVNMKAKKASLKSINESVLIQNSKNLEENKITTKTKRALPGFLTGGLSAVPMCGLVLAGSKVALTQPIGICALAASGIIGSLRGTESKVTTTDVEEQFDETIVKSNIDVQELTIKSGKDIILQSTNIPNKGVTLKPKGKVIRRKDEEKHTKNSSRKNDYSQLKNAAQHGVEVGSIVGDDEQTEQSFQQNLKNINFFEKIKSNVKSGINRAEKFIQSGRAKEVGKYLINKGIVRSEQALKELMIEFVTEQVLIRGGAAIGGLTGPTGAVIGAAAGATIFAAGKFTYKVISVKYQSEKAIIQVQQIMDEFEETNGIRSEHLIDAVESVYDLRSRELIKGGKGTSGRNYRRITSQLI